MPALERTIEAEGEEVTDVEVRVAFWADSVGEAAGQLGLFVTLAILIHFANSLLSDVASALH
jgi:hypothetical protein